MQPRTETLIHVDAKKSKAATSPTSLDDNGFSVETEAGALTPCQRRIHAKNLAAYRHFQTVVRHAEKDPGRRAKAYACGSNAMVMHHRDRDELRLKVFGCENRTCPTCGPRMARDYAERMQTWIGSPKPNEWRMITLTLKSSPMGSLAASLAHLRESFRRLRQSNAWKKSQVYGRAFVEVTLDAHSTSWHPHIHVLSRGTFWSQADLAKKWAKASDGSSICDVRAIYDGPESIKYVTCYLGKLPSADGQPMPLTAAIEYYQAIQHAKMVIPFGECPPFPKPGDGDFPASEAGEWTELVTFNELWRLATSGDVEAIRILKIIDLAIEASMHENTS